MKNVDTKNIEILFTYHDIYPDRPEFDIKKEIEKIDYRLAVSVICELIQSLNYKVNVEGLPFCFPFEFVLKKEFCEIEPNALGEFKNCPVLHKNKHIISQQMLLVLLKYFLAYGKQHSGEMGRITADTYKQIIDLCLMVTEDCHRFIQSADFDIQNFVYCNYHVNSSKNIAAAFSRTYYMLEVLNQQKVQFKGVLREYINYNDDYIKHYGFGILETISVLFWEARAYIGTEALRLQYAPLWKRIDDIYGNTALYETAQKVLDLLSTSVSDSTEWAIKTIDQIWNFNRFLSFPFLSLVDGEYISVSEYTLKNAFFENVFWLIRACYPDDSKSAMAFYGRLFELYIQRLSKSAADSSICEYIDEFDFGRDKKRSSDAYIKSGNQLIVIEAKGFSILISSLVDKDIERNNNKLFVNPILEANKCFYNIRQSTDKRFDDVEELFIVSVTMDNINAVPGYLSDITERIVDKKKETGVVEHYYNMSIDEYEMLMRLLETGKDIFSILLEYSELPEMLPISNFLRIKNGEPISMTAFMKEIYQSASEKMKSLYGINK